MAKRFLDNGIFKNPSFKELPPKLKLFYIYLICECDHCGIYTVELDVASVRIGEQITVNDAQNYLGNKIVPIDNGKRWFLPQFIFLQYGNLNATNKLHYAVRKQLAIYNLLEVLNLYEKSQTVTELLPNSYVTPKDKDKDKVKDKVKDSRGGMGGTKNPKKTPVAEKPIFKPLDEADTPSGTDIPNEGRNEPTSDYTRFMEAYHKFIQNRGTPFRINGGDGKALKEIIEYLNSVDTVRQGLRNSYDLWTFILDNWSNLDNWQQTQTQLRQINSQLPNIIEKLKMHYNGKPKQNNQTGATVANLANALRDAIKNG